MLPVVGERMKSDGLILYKLERLIPVASHNWMHCCTHGLRYRLGRADSSGDDMRATADVLRDGKPSSRLVNSYSPKTLRSAES